MGHAEDPNVIADLKTSKKTRQSEGVLFDVVYTTCGWYSTHHFVKNLDKLHHGMKDQVCLLYFWETRDGTRPWLCCGLTWELSCFSKVPKYDKPLLRRIFRQSTNSYTLRKFQDKNPVQRYRSIIKHFVHSNWHPDASDVSTDCSAIATVIATRALAALLLLQTITLPPPETSKRSHSSG